MFRNIIEFIKECDFEDIIVFPLLIIDISIVWLVAYAIGCR